MQGEKPVKISAEAHAGLCELRRSEGVKIGHAAEQAIRGYLASRGIFFADNNRGHVTPTVLKNRTPGSYLASLSDRKPYTVKGKKPRKKGKEGKP